MEGRKEKEGRNEGRLKGKNDGPERKERKRRRGMKEE